MQHQPNKRERHEFDTKGYNISIVGSQGWHYGNTGDSFMLPNGISESSFGLHQLNTGWSQPNGGQVSGMQDSGCRQEHGSIAPSVVQTAVGDYFMQNSQSDHIGSSNTCTSYTYLEPHLRDGAPVDGRQKLIYPEFRGASQYGTTSPVVMPEEPIYVNAKQYHGILRRRQLRAKAELENKVTRVRKPYLHESRHLHALRRARGCGGRFINMKKTDNSSRNSTHEGSNNSTNRTGNSPLFHAPDSGYAPTITSGLVEPSSSCNEVKRRSSQETNGLQFLHQGNCHKSLLSE